jgi:four helix bundle protein
MQQIPNNKNYDLEDRTLAYAKNVRNYIKNLPKTTSNIEYSKQGIRASSSVAANYIEANESLSKKDFIFRAKISKKEAKECRLWLTLSEPTKEQELDRERLIKESNELMKIFGAIVEKSESHI